MRELAPYARVMESTDHFTVHDVSEFPVVRSRATAVGPGYATQWEREMNALLEHASPFVLLMEEGQPQESHDDRKARGLWLKRNKTALASFCKAVIIIEPDAVQREAFQAQAAMAAKAFGVPMEVAASKAGAEELAGRLLGR